MASTLRPRLSSFDAQERKRLASFDARDRLTSFSFDAREGFDTISLPNHSNSCHTIDESDSSESGNYSDTHERPRLVKVERVGGFRMKGKNVCIRRI
jgi:hypothetical protein